MTAFKADIAHARIVNTNIMNGSSYPVWWRRVATYAIDMVIITLITVLIIGIYDYFNNSGGFEELFRFLNFLDYVVLIFIGVYFFYYLVMESIFCLTTGKLFTKTRVVDNVGNKPTFWKILLRSIIRLIPFDWFTFFHRNPQGWHDKGSKTKVVQKTKSHT